MEVEVLGKRMRMEVPEKRMKSTRILEKSIWQSFLRRQPPSPPLLGLPLTCSLCGRSRFSQLPARGNGGRGS